MVKHSTHKRAYNTHRRAYKKRRTARRLKRTLRRTIQKGGNPLIAMFGLVLVTLIGGDKLASFLKMIQFFTGSGGQSGGSNDKTIQTGGGGAKDLVIEELTKIRQEYSDAGRSNPDNEKMYNCITSILAKIQKIQGMPPSTTQPESFNIEKEMTNDDTGSQYKLSKISSANDKMEYLKLFLQEKLTIFKAKLNGHINKVLNEGKEYMRKTLGLTNDEIECLIKIKDKKVNEFTAFSEGKFQKLKEEVLANPLAATVLGGVGAVKDRAAAAAAAGKERALAFFNYSRPNTPAASPPLEISSAAGTSKQIIPAQASNAVNAAKENAAAAAAAAKEHAALLASKIPFKLPGKFW